MTRQTAIQKPLSRIRIIYNNDMECMDFLSDLSDREPVHALERYVNFSKRENCCLLHNCHLDGIVVLVLYRAPLQLNEGDNKLIVFAYKDIRGLYGYFQRWLEAADENDLNMCKALRDITGLLGYHWAIEQEPDDNEVQSDFLG